MMNWERKGVIFKNIGYSGWRDNSALQPTPLLINKKIRFYVGFRDVSGTSRVGFIDVAADDPGKIVTISEEPVLDIGQDGSFDEFGVVPSAVIRVGNKIYMYYAGYQLGKKVRFLVLSGLAISEDGGNTFLRHSRVPVFERTDREMLFRVPHTVLFEDAKFRFWYGGGDRFAQCRDKTLPVYDVRYLESDDGVKIPNSGINILKIKDDEYRIGRPFVVKGNKKYHMFYGFSTLNIPYKLGYATSNDGFSWTRRDEDLNLPLSESGWDSQMMAYPAIVSTGLKTYLFYNGNEYGRDGFGYAILKGELD